MPRKAIAVPQSWQETFETLIEETVRLAADDFESVEKCRPNRADFGDWQINITSDFNRSTARIVVGVGCGDIVKTTSWKLSADPSAENWWLKPAR